jgi:hypothetical protein
VGLGPWEFNSPLPHQPRSEAQRQGARRCNRRRLLHARLSGPPLPCLQSPTRTEVGSLSLVLQFNHPVKPFLVFAAVPPRPARRTALAAALLNVIVLVNDGVITLVARSRSSEDKQKGRLGDMPMR